MRALILTLMLALLLVPPLGLATEYYEPYILDLTYSCCGPDRFVDGLPIFSHFVPALDFYNLGITDGILFVSAPPIVDHDPTSLGASIPLTIGSSFFIGFGTNTVPGATLCWERWMEFRYPCKGYGQIDGVVTFVSDTSIRGIGTLRYPGFTFADFSLPNPIPEPSTIALLLTGVLALGLRVQHLGRRSRIGRQPPPVL
ncbi:PEP-CTERM sorting domain-containing protein [Candidatus Nitrospira bockiana]